MIYDLNANGWNLIHRMAAELVLRKADRAVIEKVKAYIQTERPDRQKLQKWLNAFEQDGYLGARSNQTWNQHRTAKVLVDTVLEMTDNDIFYANFIIAWVARLMDYYKNEPVEARNVLNGADGKLIPDLDPNLRPPVVPSVQQVIAKPRNSEGSNTLSADEVLRYMNRKDQQE